MTALTTEAFLRHVQQMPGGAAEVLARLRRQSVRPGGVRADPLALPGGAAGERAWHDRQMALRRQLKALLAGNKLHAGLVTAALSRPAADGAPETPDGATNGGVTDYVERAGRWIEAVTDALARRWGADPGADQAAGEATDGAADEAAEGTALTGYHRHELARTLVAALRDLSELPERVEPERMAAYLAALAAPYRWALAALSDPEIDPEADPGDGPLDGLFRRIDVAWPPAEVHRVHDAAERPAARPYPRALSAAHHP